MANAQRGEVSLQAGGETYRLAFTTNSICELEDAVGVSITVFNKRFLVKPEEVKLFDLRLLLWGAMLEHHDGATIKDAGRLIDNVGFAQAAQDAMKALELYFPDPVEGKSAAGKPKVSKPQSAG
ncbi:MAG: hypothetical protein II336_18130 [Loktanella sp.]|nr:hypothetical protein [Loktanella sp.]